MAKIFV